MSEKTDIPTSSEGPPPFMPEAAQPLIQPKPPRRILYMGETQEATSPGILAAGVPDTD